jgi:ADP-heptose:LPS heptosyltransferase
MLVALLPLPGRARRGRVDTVLAIRPGGIGDAALLIPALDRIKAAFPQSRVEVLAEKRNAQVFKLSPAVDRVLCYDNFADLFHVLGRRYDVVIDTEQWHRLSAVVARVVGAGIRIGFGTNERRRLFHHAVPYSQETYEGKSFLNLLAPLGIEASEWPSEKFLQIPEGDDRCAEMLLRGRHPEMIVTLFPGASIAERRWSVESFSELSLRLFRRGLQPVVIGGQEDQDAAERIAVASGALNLAGKTTLMQSAAVIQKSSLLVSGDSGILHIGVGLGVPTVSLFGPGRALKWAPRGSKHIILNKNRPCSPCTTFGYTPKCPDDARCIQDISIDDVFHAVLSLLELQ